MLMLHYSLNNDDRLSVQWSKTMTDSVFSRLVNPLLGSTAQRWQKLFALKRAVEVAADQGYNKVIFASDCLSMIQGILSCKPDRSPVGMLVRDIKRMAMNFGSAIFRHVKRSLNVAAHILARTCDVTSLGFISFSAPVSIRKTFCIDVM
jgi:hypothetical protein